jgi:hypothetical protein
LAGIAFFFEDNDTDVYSGRRVDLDAWNYASKMSNDIDRAIIVNRTDQKLQSFDRAMDIEIVDTLPELDGTVTRVVTPWSADDDTVELYDFDHRTDWYVFGPAAGFSPDGSSVTIPQAGRGAMHSVHTASVVMAHRHFVLRGDL